MTTETAGGLVPLAKMYNHPPEITKVKGADYLGYNVFKHEYQFSKAEEQITFTVKASKKSPIANICFAIKNWGQDQMASITVNEERIESGRGNRQGIIRDTDGTRTLIIWLKQKSTKPVKCTIVSL